MDRPMLSLTIVEAGSSLRTPLRLLKQGLRRITKCGWRGPWLGSASQYHLCILSLAILKTALAARMGFWLSSFRMWNMCAACWAFDTKWRILDVALKLLCEAVEQHIEGVAKFARESKRRRMISSATRRRLFLDLVAGLICTESAWSKGMRIARDTPIGSAWVPHSLWRSALMHWVWLVDIVGVDVAEAASPSMGQEEHPVPDPECGRVAWGSCKGAEGSAMRR